VVRAVKGAICRLFGHKRVEVRVFVLDRALPIGENVCLSANLPDDVGVKWAKALYGEFGHEEKRILCKRCGRWWKP
jgi:hypothetical protein